MNIGIDISCLSAPKTGVGLYTYHLIHALLSIDTNNTYHLFSAQPIDVSEFSQYRVAISCSQYPRTCATLWEQLVLPNLLQKNNIDVFHSPNYTLPFSIRIPSVVTVHDLSVFLFPKFHPWWRRVRHRLLFPSSINHATNIIAVSEQTKRDLTELFPFAADKTVTIYNGLPKCFHNPSSRNAAQEIMLPAEYILFVGTMEPRKNLELMLTAFARFKQETNLPHKLVIIGGEGWGKNHISAQLRQYKIQDDVIFTGHLEHAQLPQIYRSAAVLVFPSTYEGFGFPPLEAMACGTPVIASNVAAIPEVVGDAGILLDPTKLDLWPESIYNVIINKPLREELQAKGLARAKQFSWETTAQKTIELYQQAVTG
ncbi:MAG: glycosyltransferase family 4 protein [bacterium]|nr:glycosyltransferase family 4 protein [bacterium]